MSFKLRDRVIQDQMRAPEARLSRNIRDTVSISFFVIIVKINLAHI